MPRYYNKKSYTTSKIKKRPTRVRKVRKFGNSVCEHNNNPINATGELSTNTGNQTDHTAKRLQHKATQAFGIPPRKSTVKLLSDATTQTSVQMLPDGIPVASSSQLAPREESESPVSGTAIEKQLELTSTTNLEEKQSLKQVYPAGDCANESTFKESKLISMYDEQIVPKLASQENQNDTKEIEQDEASRQLVALNYPLGDSSHSEECVSRDRATNSPNNNINKSNERGQVVESQSTSDSSEWTDDNSSNESESEEYFCISRKHLSQSIATVRRFLRLEDIDNRCHICGKPRKIKLMYVPYFIINAHDHSASTKKKKSFCDTQESTTSFENTQDDRERLSMLNDQTTSNYSISDSQTMETNDDCKYTERGTNIPEQDNAEFTNNNTAQSELETSIGEDILVEQLEGNQQQSASAIEERRPRHYGSSYIELFEKLSLSEEALAGDECPQKYDENWSDASSDSSEYYTCLEDLSSNDEI